MSNLKETEAALNHATSPEARAMLQLILQSERDHMVGHGFTQEQAMAHLDEILGESR